MSLSFDGPQLDELAERRFERCLVDILAAGDASARNLLGAEAGRSDLKQQISQARQYGMTGDLDIARYVITAWQLGLDFDKRFPAMAEILTAERLSGSQKAEAIERVCVAVMAELQAAATGGT